MVLTPLLYPGWALATVEPFANIFVKQLGQQAHLGKLLSSYANSYSQFHH